jgi:hypothetical protein
MTSIFTTGLAMDTFEPNQSDVTGQSSEQLSGHPTPPKRRSRKPRKSIDLIQWIGLVDRLEAGARYLFLGMAALSFLAYGYMVHTQDQWQGQHRQLQKLRNQETQQAIINARLRNQAAELAEKDPTMANPDPQRAVFLPIDTQPAKASNKTAGAATPTEISAPVGY